MTHLAPDGTIDLGDQQLEYRFAGPQPGAAPTIVMLHEGLGCAGLWGTFVDRLAEATGLGVFAYSRAGYGASSPVPLPRPLTYMHEEALAVLPRLLDAIGFERGILLGHSDGGSIVAIYCGAIKDPRVIGAVLIAPHFFTEDYGLREIVNARRLYDTGDLRPRLARWHTHVDVAFNGWCDAWLDPGFKQWNLTEYLPPITCPVQVIQGDADLYGTMKQVETLESLCGSPVERVVLPGVGHSPHREAPEGARDAIARFCQRMFKSTEVA